MTTSYSAMVLKELLNSVNTILKQNPDAKNNMGKVLAEMYVWDEIAKLAKKRSDDLWDRAEKNGIYSSSGLNPGVHTLADSPAFTLVAKISQPVLRFNQQKLAEQLKASKYKVPEPITIQLCETSKVPTKSSITLSVAERV